MPNSTSVIWNKMKKPIPEILALIVWVYVGTKIFFFNPDNLIIPHIKNDFLWIYNYRTIFLILILSLFWYTIGSLRFFKSLFYILLYPFLFLLWKLPKLFLWRIPRIMYKKNNWVLMYSYFNGIINNIYSLRVNLICWSSLLIALLILIFGELNLLLYTSLVVFFLLLAFHVYQRFKLAFSPIRMFRLNLEILSFKEKKKADFITNTVNDFEKYKLKENDKEKIEDKRIRSIETLFLAHRFLKFICLTSAKSELFKVKF